MQHAELMVAVLGALTPTVAIFLATLIGRQDIRDLRSKTRDLRSEMVQVRAEMISLRNQVHADMLMIHERVAKVESKQE